jgi:hypothetical protein
VRLVLGFRLRVWMFSFFNVIGRLTYRKDESVSKKNTSTPSTCLSLQYSLILLLRQTEKTDLFPNGSSFRIERETADEDEDDDDL